MRPLKLTMQAFGSYSDAITIDFTKPEQNLFLITGNTGSGKSTIFDAIVFALYGEASSESNKKDGTELQSHYTDKESFVELEFSEKKGTEEFKYNIRREPNQFKINPKTKKIKKTSETEKIFLTMPDGTELTQKSAKEKINEIVILTKEQFMQISMIAQGEFMKFLRSPSKEKKEIFRTIFNTGIYDDIVTKLHECVTEKKKARDNADADYRRDAKHIRIPEDCQNMSELRGKFVSGNGTAESFVNSFEIFCDEMKNRKTFAEMKFNEISDVQKIREKSYDTAENFIRIFTELENKKKEIPELESKLKILSEDEKNAHREKDIAIENFAKTESEVNANIEKLSALSRIKKEITLRNNAMHEYENLVEIIENDLKKCEENISGYEKIINENSGAEKLFYEWQNKKFVCESAVEAYGKIIHQKKISGLAKMYYSHARREYEIKKRQYDAEYRAFMDLQAGIIARDELRDNMPCPVCGSLEHPKPCRLPEKYDNLDSKAIDNLKKEVGKLEQNMQKQSENAHTQNELLKNVIEDFNEKAKKFREIMPEIPEFENIENAGKILYAQKSDLDKKCDILQKNTEKYNTAINALN
nr:SMC family ATPase [Ruminococcus sp.]